MADQALLLSVGRHLGSVARNRGCPRRGERDMCPGSAPFMTQLMFPSRLPVPSLEVGAAPGHGLNRDRGGGGHGGGDVERGGEGRGSIYGEEASREQAIAGQAKGAMEAPEK